MKKKEGKYPIKDSLKFVFKFQRKFAIIIFLRKFLPHVFIVLNSNFKGSSLKLALHFQDCHISFYALCNDRSLE